MSFLLVILSLEQYFGRFAEAIQMLFGVVGQAGTRNHVLDGCAHWRHLSDMVERLCAVATSQSCHQWCRCSLIPNYFGNPVIIITWYKIVFLGAKFYWKHICIMTTAFRLLQPFYSPLSGSTRVSWYQKQHSPTHTYADHHYPLSAASISSLFKLRACQSFCTTSVQEWSTSWSGTFHFTFTTLTTLTVTKEAVCRNFPSYLR